MKACSEGSIAIDAALIGRFADALARLRPAGARIGLAVSGGPDSMAMLLLAQEAIPGEFAVASVNHGLRAEAADECALVMAQCEQRGVPFKVLNVTVSQGNLQDAARTARYAALGEWAQGQQVVAIATAHHIDDQAETLLMRLNRGSGVAGLAGVREQGMVEGCDVPVIRPVLGFRRAELAQVLAEAGVAVAHDPSNEDTRFERVRMRAALADTAWLDPAALAQSAAHLAEADALLDSLLDEAGLADALRGEAPWRVKPPEVRVLRLRMLTRALEQLGAHPRGSDVARLLDRLERDKSGNLAGILVAPEGADWIMRPEPGRGSR